MPIGTRDRPNPQVELVGKDEDPAPAVRPELAPSFRSDPSGCPARQPLVQFGGESRREVKDRTRTMGHGAAFADDFSADAPKGRAGLNLSDARP
jgi:hypothetical protein